MSSRLPARHSVAEHIARIEATLDRAREAFFDVVIALKEARDDLGHETFQKELANRLSISEATVTKYLRIAGDPVLLKHRDSLPPTMNTLYELALAHDELIKVRGPQEGDAEFKELLESVKKTTEAAEIADYLKKIRQEGAAAAKKKREEKLLNVSGSKAAKEAPVAELTTLAALAQSKSVFRTVFVDPPERVLKWAGDDGVFVEDIAKKFPIADLRAPSQGETVQGFVYCPASEIDAGLKMLAAAGFKFRDVFTPMGAGKGFELLRDQKVLLRGERGAPTRPALTVDVEGGDAGAVAIAQALGSEPRLYVFASRAVEGWTCANADHQ